MKLQEKIPYLQQKSKLIQQIREYFFQKGYWECETPLITQYASIEEHIDSFCLSSQDSKNTKRYLITSPEYFMKRLLVAGSGDCFQITKVFREHEQGQMHNSEFTMLEWYKIGKEPYALIEEVQELFQLVLNIHHCTRQSYASIFEEKLEIDIFHLEQKQLQKIKAEYSQNIDLSHFDTQEILDYLFSFYIQPKLGKENPVFVTDFPKEQASLAKLNADQKTASRFEAFYQGVELCNGYFEICDGIALKKRFEEINQARIKNGREPYPINEGLIQDFQGQKFPEYSGVALGIDRIVMLCLGLGGIQPLIAFDFDEA